MVFGYFDPVKLFFDNTDTDVSVLKASLAVIGHSRSTTIIKQRMSLGPEATFEEYVNHPPLEDIHAEVGLNMLNAFNDNAADKEAKLMLEEAENERQKALEASTSAGGSRMSAHTPHRTVRKSHGGAADTNAGNGDASREAYLKKIMDDRESDGSARVYAYRETSVDGALGSRPESGAEVRFSAVL